MMISTVSGGLNRRGLGLTWDLNPAWSLTVTRPDPADVKVYVIADSTVTIVTTEGKAFLLDQSSFHPDDDVGVESVQTTPTGLSPQADPQRVFSDKVSTFAPEEGGTEGTATARTDQDPQPDPDREFKDKESGTD